MQLVELLHLPKLLHLLELLQLVKQQALPTGPVLELLSIVPEGSSLGEQGVVEHCLRQVPLGFVPMSWPVTLGTLAMLWYC